MNSTIPILGFLFIIVKVQINTQSKLHNSSRNYVCCSAARCRCWGVKNAAFFKSTPISTALFYKKQVQKINIITLSFWNLKKLQTWSSTSSLLNYWYNYDFALSISANIAQQGSNRSFKQSECWDEPLNPCLRSLHFFRSINITNVFLILLRFT